MEAVKARGYLLHTTLKYLQEGMAADRRSKAYQSVKPETVRLVEAAKPTEWYDVGIYNELLEAVASASNGDGVTAENDLVRCGTFAANEATNTFLRLFMKVLTPALFAKKLPSLFERDFSAGKVKVEVADDRLICSLKNVRAFRHVAACSSGFATFTLETMGKKLLDRKIRGWSISDPQPEECEFELIWQE